MKELRRRERTALPNSLALGRLTLHLLQQQSRWQIFRAPSQYSQFHPCVPELRVPVDGFECVEWSLVPPPFFPGAHLPIVSEVRVWRKRSVRACEIEDPGMQTCRHHDGK
ncbi:hypothetical protein ILYODFUR_037601 [Ilyodon furcidens]|uniref:Uncharacterized protein n=1 Tax=Ilyodon furcidens TaxID=33524 RepID=A0ABV0UYG9_9TELE